MLQIIGVNATMLFHNLFKIKIEDGEMMILAGDFDAVLGPKLVKSEENLKQAQFQTFFFKIFER